MKCLNINNKSILCVIVEIFEVVKLGKPYDNDRYVKNLEKLPEEPYD